MIISSLSSRGRASIKLKPYLRPITAGAAALALGALNLSPSFGTEPVSVAHPMIYIQPVGSIDAISASVCKADLHKSNKQTVTDCVTEQSALLNDLLGKLQDKFENTGADVIRPKPLLNWSPDRAEKLTPLNVTHIIVATFKAGPESGADAPDETVHVTWEVGRFGAEDGRRQLLFYSRIVDESGDDVTVITGPDRKSATGVKAEIFKWFEEDHRWETRPIKDTVGFIADQVSQLLPEFDNQYRVYISCFSGVGKHTDHVEDILARRVPYQAELMLLSDLAEELTRNDGTPPYWQFEPPIPNNSAAFQLAMDNRCNDGGPPTPGTVHYTISGSMGPRAEETGALRASRIPVSATLSDEAIKRSFKNAKIRNIGLSPNFAARTQRRIEYGKTHGAISFNNFCADAAIIRSHTRDVAKGLAAYIRGNMDATDVGSDISSAKLPDTTWICSDDAQKQKAN